MADDFRVVEKREIGQDVERLGDIRPDLVRKFRHHLDGNVRNGLLAAKHLLRLLGRETPDLPVGRYQSVQCIRRGKHPLGRCKGGEPPLVRKAGDVLRVLADEAVRSQVEELRPAVRDLVDQRRQGFPVGIAPGIQRHEGTRRS